MTPNRRLNHADWRWSAPSLRTMTRGHDAIGESFVNHNIPAERRSPGTLFMMKLSMRPGPRQWQAVGLEQGLSGPVARNLVEGFSRSLRGPGAGHPVTYRYDGVPL